MSASSLAEVSAARGGLEGGEGSPELTSGIPLCPYIKRNVSKLLRDISCVLEGKAYRRRR